MPDFSVNIVLANRKGVYKINVAQSKGVSSGSDGEIENRHVFIKCLCYLRFQVLQLRLSCSSPKIELMQITICRPDPLFLIMFLKTSTCMLVV